MTSNILVHTRTHIYTATYISGVSGPHTVARQLLSLSHATSMQPLSVVVSGLDSATHGDDAVDGGVGGRRCDR